MVAISSLRNPRFGGNQQSAGINPRLPQAPQQVAQVPQAVRGGLPGAGINPQLPQFQPQGPSFGINQPAGQQTGGIVPTNFQATGGVRAAPGSSFGQPQPQQQFGLSGAEQAFQAGAGAGSGAIQTGVQQGLGTLLGGFQEAQNLRGQAVDALRGFGGGGGGGGFGGGGGGAGARGFGARDAEAVQIDRQVGQGLFQQASQGVNQFTQAGVDAQQQFAALSGAQGQEAFDQARLNNPAIDFLNQRQVASVRTLPNGQSIEVNDKFRNPVPLKTMMAGLGMMSSTSRPPLGRMNAEAVARCRVTPMEASIP